MVKIEKNDNGTFYNINGTVLSSKDIAELKSHFNEEEAAHSIRDCIRDTYGISPDILDKEMLDDMVMSYTEYMKEDRGNYTLASAVVEQYDDDIWKVIDDINEEKD